MADEITQFGNVKIKDGNWQPYAKYNKAVNEVCDYLRLRRHVDGVFLHMHHFEKGYQPEK